MSRLRVAPIVEGQGEYSSVRTLLLRTWQELIGGEYLEVIRPIRRPRSKLVKKDELQKAVELAVLKLKAVSLPGDPILVLVLIDAEPDPPCPLGPKLLSYAKDARSDVDVACVLANVEYETWFVASAESLGDHLSLGPEEAVPEAPEKSRLGKGWIQKHFTGTKYSETVDQPAMTAKMDLVACRKRSPSFDKLCRELEKRLSTENKKTG